MTHDLRMVPAAIAVWSGASWMVTAPSWQAVGVAMVSVVAAAAAVAAFRMQAAGPVVLAMVCLAAVAASCAWRVTTVEHSPLAELAATHQFVTVDVEIRRDARSFVRHGEEAVVVEVLVRRVVSDGVAVRLRDRATAFIEAAADDLVVGRRLTLRGRLSPSGATDEAAVIDVLSRSSAERASWWWEGAERARAGVRQSVSHLSPEPRALVPALVDGDDSRVGEDVAEDFRRSGLTHLMAVSGTNLTIVLAVVMIVARAAGVRRLGLGLVGAAAIVAFVLLARPDPSVIRAAAMGAVGVAALGLGSRGGVRALCWAVVGLVFVDPWLSRTAGFILSVTATAGILFVAPLMARRLGRWMPSWCAHAIAVPLAAQLACTPALAALSGEVSLVAVCANVLAGPAVAPATIAGLAGGLLSLVSVPVGHVFGTAAGACASWILLIGHQCAALDSASFTWPARWQLLLIVMPLLTVAMVVLSARPVVCVGVSLGLLIGIWRPPQTGWPPPGWVMVACDVGQGDATVLSAGHGDVVVIDAGPDPGPIDQCLDRLGVRRVRLMVFTHDHADHTGGWTGVREGRRVDQIATGSTGSTGGTGGPGAPEVPGRVVAQGERFTVGDVTAEVLWPARQVSSAADSSAVNNASVVLLVRVRGVRVLLTGDIEPEAQEALVSSGRDLAAQVIKMPHHGSARQSQRFFQAVGADLATISAGAGNDHGHPAGKALALLREQGTAWWRTDLDGDVAIVERDGQILVVTRR